MQLDSGFDDNWEDAEMEDTVRECKYLRYTILTCSRAQKDSAKPPAAQDDWGDSWPGDTSAATTTNVPAGDPSDSNPAYDDGVPNDDELLLMQLEEEEVRFPAQPDSTCS